ncbi:hypothetical protein AAFF_G00009900 [Aldrovandia affinis]|uniref:Uncharacterized protein n=1 Tax=Aldrovandia affinis TaxID=143900 RepID=A0AAD7WHD4_9TELE|nr:hypothetical protein AAFF_G00009900 [Aldrovandia affinis]
MDVDVKTDWKEEGTQERLPEGMMLSRPKDRHGLSGRWSGHGCDVISRHLVGGVNNRQRELRQEGGDSQLYGTDAHLSGLHHVGHHSDEDLWDHNHTGSMLLRG